MEAAKTEDSRFKKLETFMEDSGNRLQLIETIVKVSF